MTNFRIRLVTGVAIATLVTCLIGITGILNLRKMARADQTLFREGTIPLPVLSTIAVSLQKMRIASRDLLAASGATGQATFAGQLVALSTKIDQLVREYAESWLSARERPAFDRFQAMRKTYLEYVRRIVALAKAERDGEGWAILNSEPYNAVVDAQLEAIHKLEEQQVSKAREIIANNGVLARTAILQVGAALFLGIVLFIGGGLWLDHVAGDKLRAQEALKRSENRFQLVSRATNDGIWDWDLVTGQVWWNENLKTTFGHAPDEIEPGVEGWVNHLHPEDRERVHQSISAAIEGSAASWASEYRFQRRDGTYADVLDRGYLIRDSGGRAVRMVGAMMDISQRKLMELELRQAREAAEVANRAKSEFLANMSHEIRTPMNGIIGMTELALDTELTPEQREYLGMVKSSADSLLAVINDVLDFSKIEAGRVELELIEFKLRDLLEPILKTLGLRAHEKGLELNGQVSPEVPENVVADSSRLRQVVVNLVGNAIKFTHEGEVTLRVALESGDDGLAWLHFSVQDTGIGIPTDKQSSIFTAFGQAESSIARRFGGTGLGLTISRRLVDMMGGRLWLESTPGQGSIFHFTVPHRAGQPSGEKSVEAVDLAGIHVLVVDDNSTNRRILEEVLASWSMRPTLAEDAHTALNHLDRALDAGDPFPVILVDARMPEIDGFTLVEEIRQNPLLAGAIILMLTSANRRGDAARCRELGVAAYLTKPIGQAELRQALYKALGAQSEHAHEPAASPGPSPKEVRPSLNILLAEDNSINQRLAVRLLESHNHKVEVAANGRAAVAKFETGKFDLVLMDVQMPEMDGFETTAAIRKLERRTGCHIPIIAVTASAVKGDQERCLTAGMDAYISKPIRFEELLKAIDEVAQTAALRVAGT